MTSQPPKDHWTHEAYSASASFVPELASKVVGWLDPHPEDTILDLGCGDGLLTAKIKGRCASVTGFDSSSNLLEAARRNYGSIPNLSWYVQDCRYLEHCRDVRDGAYSKVFSNAALHWILRDASTRVSVFRAAFRALKPGGELVFEMGGAGNVAEVHAALLAAVVHQGAGIDAAREASPWFFPSEELMKRILGKVGFMVEKSELEYRPTRLTTEKEGGIEGWARLMGAQILDTLPSPEQREAAVREVCDVLKTILTHEEDGNMWLGYVRLRFHARKP
ncbi:MAG: hypothetical protein HETSPECPRED_008622 [Heterodermia speciosa]|uniref:Methyltransferase domain-containing protein n=1 Tax=Heterodermia speciosa TaxID=116794 RepID=A0A8H3FW53_9LECA|nr:MAG: hypothetical protein HETSPECPRED_008622 [Heterodermia speciosa]